MRVPPSQPGRRDEKGLRTVAQQRALGDVPWAAAGVLEPRDVLLVQLAPPGQPRTTQDEPRPELRDVSLVPCVVMNQGTERAVVHFVMNAVAGARQTPGWRYHQSCQPQSFSLWSSVFWDFGSFYLTALRRRSGQLLRQRQSGSFQTLRRPCGQLLR